MPNAIRSVLLARACSHTEIPRATELPGEIPGWWPRRLMGVVPEGTAPFAVLDLEVAADAHPRS
jgi:hypothetical protein